MVFPKLHLFLSSNYINLCPLPMPLIKNVHFYYMSNKFLFIEETIHISYIFKSFIFFSLNSCFLVNSKLITNSVTPLFNNTFTIIPSYLSILSSPIFIVTFLSSSSSAFFLSPLLFSSCFTFSSLKIVSLFFLGFSRFRILAYIT